MRSESTDQSTVEIPLTRGLVAIIDAADFEIVSQFRWEAHANGKGGKFCARAVHGSAVRVRMHRVIMDAPRWLEVDHRDGDTLNNRRCNLRLATRAQNQRNTGAQSRSRTGVKGVTVSKSGGYCARITVDGQQIHLGSFATLLEASLEYDRAAAIYFREFARFNDLQSLAAE